MQFLHDFLLTVYASRVVLGCWGGSSSSGVCEATRSVSPDADAHLSLSSPASLGPLLRAHTTGVLKLSISLFL